MLNGLPRIIENEKGRIREVDAMPEVVDGESINSRVLVWKSETDAMLTLMFPNYTLEVEEFNRCWRNLMIWYGLNTTILLRLRNARTDLRLIMRVDDSSDIIAGSTGNPSAPLRSHPIPDPLRNPTKENSSKNYHIILSLHCYQLHNKDKQHNQTIQMADLQRIQERINMIPDLIREVDDLKPVFQASYCGYPVERPYCR